VKILVLERAVSTLFVLSPIIYLFVLVLTTSMEMLSPYVNSVSNRLSSILAIRHLAVSIPFVAHLVKTPSANVYQASLVLLRRVVVVQNVP
jgi:hypothetical protein